MLINIKFFLKQKVKEILNKCVLPGVYKLYSSKPIKSKKVIFADTNTDVVPDSMYEVYEKLLSQDYEIINYCMNFSKCSSSKIFKYMLSFMKDYATARCVFICNYNVPVTSCNKREGTEVVQLWHSCGLLKKFAYDTEEDISPFYHGNVTRNISLITVSSQACVPVFTNALHINQKLDIVKAIGVSRTDRFFSQEFIKKCKTLFYEKYPQCKNKKTILWAPTFRGTASNPELVGERDICNLSNALGEDYIILIKLHPHLQSTLNNCDFPTYMLYACIDIIISDYSSLIFEYAFFRKPIIIFAPDYDEYIKKRGLYIDINEIPGKIVKCSDGLKIAVLDVLNNTSNNYQEEYDKFLKKHCGACDGNSTKRILDYVFKKNDF